VGTSEATISRELKRNASKRTYSPHLAQAFSDERKERFGRVCKFSKELEKIICDKLETDYFFADTYASYQRGLNGYTNGLTRQYIPKNHTFVCINDIDIMEIQYKISRRPRKKLNFENPKKLFFHKIAFTD